MNDENIAYETQGQLGIIALDSSNELGDLVDNHLLRRRSTGKHFAPKPYRPDSYKLSVQDVRFSNGEGKIKLDESVRGKDIYILCDIGNYSRTYQMYGHTVLKGPDEHFQDIKRAISAIGGKSKRTTVIMPLLYASRQHRRKSRESLDCAFALQELERMGVKDIITFDVHDPNIQNSIPFASFENIYPTYDIVKTIIEKEKDLQMSSDQMIVISPDTGAMDRAIYYSSVMRLDVGMFYKRRDRSRLVNGKNPIVAHEYMGSSVEGKDILIVDDMIASGESVLDIVKEVKKRKARRIYVAATFALFTEGIEDFNKAYEDGLITKVYSTNLTYIAPEVCKAKWHQEVDMSNYLAKIIDYLNYNSSIAPLLDATSGINELLGRKDNH